MLLVEVALSAVRTLTLDIISGALYMAVCGNFRCVVQHFSGPSMMKKTSSSRALACVGCDIVQADHAPDGGVAQGVIHGDVIRHHGRNQEEVE